MLYWTMAIVSSSEIVVQKIAVAYRHAWQNPFRNRDQNRCTQQHVRYRGCKQIWRAFVDEAPDQSAKESKNHQRIIRSVKEGEQSSRYHSALTRMVKLAQSPVGKTQHHIL